MSINNRNYTGGAIRYSRNGDTVRMSVCGTTSGGKTVVSNFDFPVDDAASELADWSQVLRDYWHDERKRRIEIFKRQLYAGDMRFRFNNNIKDTI